MGFSENIGRKQIHFTNHALDRWWERCESNNFHGRNQALDFLRTSLADAELVKDIPEWSQVNLYHRASAEGFVAIDEDSGFVVKRNPNGDHVAVTFLDKLPND